MCQPPQCSCFGHLHYFWFIIYVCTITSNNGLHHRFRTKGSPDLWAFYLGRLTLLGGISREASFIRTAQCLHCVHSTEYGSGKVSGWVAKDKWDELMNEWPDGGRREGKTTATMTSRTISRPVICTERRAQHVKTRFKKKMHVFYRTLLYPEIRITLHSERSAWRQEEQRL